MIEKRPDSPYWYTNFTIDGVKIHKSTKRRKKVEAEAVAQEMRTDFLNRAQLGYSEEWTLEQAAEQWFKIVGSRLRDARNNESRLKKLFGRAVDKKVRRPGLDPTMPLHRLTTADLRKLKDARLEEGNSAATINRELALVGSILSYAEERGVRVPGQLRPGKLYEKRKPGKLRYFSVEEEQRILSELEPKEHENRIAVPRGEAAIRQDQRDLFIFLLDTGARYSEAATVPWDAVDLRRGTFNLYRSKVGNESELAMTERLAEVMRRRRADPALEESPYVFPSRTLRGVVDLSKPRGYATKGLRAAIDRAGCNVPHMVERFGKATVHSARDTFATRLVQAGCSLYEVQMALGHASPQMTQKYAHLSSRHVAVKLAKVLDGIHAKHVPEPSGPQSESRMDSKAASLEATGVAWTAEERALMDDWSHGGPGRTVSVFQCPGGAVALCFAFVDGTDVGGWARRAAGCWEFDRLQNTLRADESLAKLLNDGGPLFPSALVWSVEERATLQRWEDAQENADHYLQFADELPFEDDPEGLCGGVLVQANGVRVGRIVKRSHGVAALGHDDQTLAEAPSLDLLLANPLQFEAQGCPQMA